MQMPTNDNKRMSISCKISILSLCATVMVMYRHSLNFIAFFGEYSRHSYNGDFQDIVWMFTEMAVPFFFMVSGYFFFRKDYYQKGIYLEMLRKKWKTLAVPFLIFNIFCIPIFAYAGGTPMPDSFGMYIYNVATSDFYGPLWYVRDLIIMMVAVPLYYWIFKVDKLWLYLITAICTFLLWHPYEYCVLASVGVFCFPLGGILARYEKLLSWQAPKWTVALLGVVWLVLYFLPHYDISFAYRYCIAILVSVMFAWNIVNFFPKKWCDWLMQYSPYAFFMYVTHYYLIKILKRVAGNIFFGSDFASLVTYIALPLVCCVLLITTAKFMERHFAALYSVLVGGRTSGQRRKQ